MGAINRKFDYRSCCLKNFIVLVDTYGKIVSVAINDSRDFIFTHSFELYWLISLKNLSSDIFFWFSSSFWGNLEKIKSFNLTFNL